MKHPTRAQAQRYLREAETMNPGPWVRHSLRVAQAAQAIARKCKGLDGDRAYVFGCLHDIGRRCGVTDVRHILDGYDFLMEEGYPAEARICLTHCFPVIRSTSMATGRWDCTRREKRFVADYLDGIRYTKYDQLIQLCDALALPDGFCLIEKRLIEIAIRRRVTKHSPAKWRAFLDLQGMFDKLTGGSIYRLLPGVVENTFGFVPRCKRTGTRT